MAGDLAPLLTLALLAGAFAMFAWERYPPEVVALTALALLLTAGVLSIEDALAAMANPAPATIACMFVLSRALMRVGLLDTASRFLLDRARSRPKLAMAVGGVVLVVASAFMNNTPVVVLMIPIAVQMAAQMEFGASRLLIPVSYCAILGGLCTLIGTSTNLLVDGVARSHGLAPFGFFEITPLGVTLALTGLVYLALAGPRLLPDRARPADLARRRKTLRFMTELAIPESSTLIGRRPAEVDLLRREGISLIDILRGDVSLRRNLDAVVLEEGDRLVLRTGVHDLIDLRHARGLKTVDRISQKNTVTVEALISPDCRLVGRSLGKARLRRRYGVYPLAVHRRGPLESSRLDDIVIRVGDTLLLEGDRDDINRMAEDANLVDLSEPSARPYRREHAPIVAGAFLGVVILSSLGVAEIAPLAVLAVAVVLLTRCIDVDEASAAVDGRLLALILCMLGFGAALESTGAVSLLVDAAGPALLATPPWLLLWGVIALTSILTEAVTNNAVAVVMTPVAIALAVAVGVDPRPFVVGVMVGASASFATPIGYQTNTLVYAPGGYRFSDYLRIGAPLNLLIGVIAAAVIPLLWPLGG